MAALERSRGKVWLVGAGPGDPDLITCRGRTVLERAEVVLYDALSHPELLEYAPGAELINVGKRYGERSPAQETITRELIAHAQKGKRVVRLKGGDPMLFARGSEEALALEEAGIPFEVVPGIASPVAAAEFSGIPLTHRDLSSSVTFITGSDQAGREWTKEAWTRLATATGTICVLMGMRRIREITSALIEGGRDPNTPAAVVRWAARPEQQTLTGPLHGIADLVESKGLRSPAIIIVGEVVGLRERLAWYDTKPLFSQRILVTRPRAQAAETVSKIRARSAFALVAPAIRIAPPPDPSAFEDAVRRAKSFDWVVFTSQNGVDSFFHTAQELGLDARLFGSARIATIGPKTASALTRYGLRSDLVAPEYIAESLTEELLKLSPRPERVLLARALEAREVLPEALTKAGIFVEIAFAYRTELVSGDEAEQLKKALESSTTVLLTSSSIVRSLVQAIGFDTSLLEDKTILSIGPVTSATARELGLTVHVEAREYTIDGALDALELHLTRDRVSGV